MKGPDPADFYPGLFTQSWAFVGKNQKLALRTVVVHSGQPVVCEHVRVLLPVSVDVADAYFPGLCCTISFLVIPGWMWFLDTEVIKLTLERKDKFKKLNFDFFLASAMGAAFVLWCIVFAGPLDSDPRGARLLFCGSPCRSDENSRDAANLHCSGIDSINLDVPCCDGSHDDASTVQGLAALENGAPLVAQH